MIFSLRSAIMQRFAYPAINQAYHPTLILTTYKLNHLDMLDVTILERSRQDLDQMWIIEHLALNFLQGVYKAINPLEHLLAISLSLILEKLTFSLVAGATLSLRYTTHLHALKYVERRVTYGVHARIRVKVRGSEL